MKTPETHLTLHENGTWSLIHQGIPLTAPTTRDAAEVACKRLLPKVNPNNLPVWGAVSGGFVPQMAAHRQNM